MVHDVLNVDDVLPKSCMLPYEREICANSNMNSTRITPSWAVYEQSTVRLSFNKKIERLDQILEIAATQKHEIEESECAS